MSSARPVQASRTMAGDAEEAGKTLEMKGLQYASVDFSWTPKRCSTGKQAYRASQKLVLAFNDMRIPVTLELTHKNKHSRLELSYEIDQEAVLDGTGEIRWRVATNKPKIKPNPSMTPDRNIKIGFDFKQVPKDLKLQVFFHVELGEVAMTHRKSFSQEMASLLDSNCLTDVTLVCDGEEFACHKLVLAAHSPVFRAMLTNEAYKETSTGKINIQDISTAELKMMISFMYSRDTKGLKNNAEKLLELSDRYDIQDLKAACEATLKDNISNYDLGNLFVLAARYNAEMLKKAVINIIMDNKAALKENPQQLKKLLLQDASLATELWLALTDNDVISSCPQLKQTLSKNAKVATEMVFKALNS